MLCIGYLIILDGQSIKKIIFGHFHFSAAKTGKLQKQVVPQPPWDPPPPPPEHPNRGENT